MIEFKDVSKTFAVYASPSDRLIEALSGRTRHHEHRVINGLSFAVSPGETLAIIGKNGAGKSTVLKLLTGVMLPDNGSIHIDGRVTGLLELGTGFDMRLSGRRNILNNGLLLGMSAEDLEQRTEQIIAFAELGSYIDEPMRTYSSGMIMRLGFAVAIHADPDCFVVDEALSVGDAHFQQKCIRKIRDFRNRGGSIIFVSHDLNAVKMIADRAIVLDSGAVAASGDVEDCVNTYNQIIANQLGEEATQEQDLGYGSFEVRIDSATLLSKDNGAPTIACGEKAVLSIELESTIDSDEVVVGFMIRDRFGQDVFGTNTFLLGKKLVVSKGERTRFDLTIDMALHPGKYTLTLAVHEDDNHLNTCFHWWDNAVRFEVAGVLGALFSGVCRLPVDCETGD